MKTIITTLFILFYFVYFSQMSDLEKAVFEEFKIYKKNYNGNTVKLDTTLSFGCKEHSITMYKVVNLFHAKMDGVSFKSEICQESFATSKSTKENSKFILDGFLVSSEHTKLLREKSEYMGVGIFVDQYDNYWVTIRFR
jgi:uncharacterized protein YkwD